MRLALPFSILLGALLLAAPLLAMPNLTGTYEGTASCKGVDAVGLKESNKMDLRVSVSQPSTSANAADLQVLTELVDPATQVVVGVYYWFGGILFDPKAPDKKGQGALTECTHLAAPTTAYQIAHLSYGVTPEDVKGRIKFLSISNFTGSDGAIATCKASLKRVSTAEPLVPYCP